MNENEGCAVSLFAFLLGVLVAVWITRTYKDSVICDLRYAHVTTELDSLRIRDKYDCPITKTVKP